MTERVKVLQSGTTLTVFNRRFDVFYDRGIRSWTIIEKNASGNQVGDASYAASHDMACVSVGILAASTEG